MNLSQNSEGTKGLSMNENEGKRRGDASTLGALIGMLQEVSEERIRSNDEAAAVLNALLTELEGYRNARWPKHTSAAAISRRLVRAVVLDTMVPSAVAERAKALRLDLEELELMKRYRSKMKVRPTP